MTTTTSTAVPSIGPFITDDGSSARHRPAAHSSFARLVEVETRKLVDTRASHWLLVAGALVTAGMLLLHTVMQLQVSRTDPTMGVSWISTTRAVGGVFGTFLGLLGVLTLTGEWSQRTAMTTFALEPRRGRVLAAKGTVLALATTLLNVLALAIGAAVVAGLRGAGFTASWDLPAAQLGGLVAMTFFNTATGAAFGLLLLHSAAGLVAFLTVPMLWGLVANVATVWETMSQVAPWLVPTPSTLALQNGTIAGVQWWQLTVTTLLWLALPAAVGTWRWLRRQVA